MDFVFKHIIRFILAAHFMLMSLGKLVDNRSFSENLLMISWIPRESSLYVGLAVGIIEGFFAWTLFTKPKFMNLVTAILVVWSLAYVALGYYSKAMDLHFSNFDYGVLLPRSFDLEVWLQHAAVAILGCFVFYLAMKNPPPGRRKGDK